MTWDLRPDETEQTEQTEQAEQAEQRPHLAPPPPMEVPPQSWSHEQLERLENEWRRLQRNFAYHPHILIRPLKGNPPDEYEVEYRLRTLVMPPGQPLNFAESCHVQIWLPPSFPHAAPVVQPLDQVFHPNVVPEAVELVPAWEPTTTLADVVTEVGKLLAFQVYDPANAWNEPAMQWVNDNPQYLPVDDRADLTPQAGGEPIERLCRLGPATIEQIRKQFVEMCERLLQPQAPADLQVRDFAEQTRLALTLFLEDDVPESLREPASALDDAARELEASMGAWGALRAQHRGAGGAEQIAHAMHESRRALLGEMMKSAEQPAAQPVGNAAELLKHIPPSATLQHELGRIEGLILQVEREHEEGQKRLSGIDALPGVVVPGTGLVGRRLDAEKSRAAERVTAARGELASQIGQVEPILQRARQREAALRRMIQWREYRDLVAKARDLLDQLKTWGAAGVEAFYIENEAGNFGPFPFEQELSLGPASVAVRNLGPTELAVLKASNGQVLTRNAEGQGSIAVRDPETGQKFTTVFRMTARCDELIVQLGYLSGETRAAFARVQEPLDAGDCGMGRLHAALGAAEAMGQLRQEQAGIEKQCRAAAEDLEALAPFKQRLATYSMVQRMSEAVPTMRQKLATAKQTLEESTRRIEQIARASNTNLDTGQLQVPAKFAKEYPQQVLARDQARQRLAQLTRLLQLEGEALARRLESAELLGYAVAPQMQAMPALPEELVQLQPAMTTPAMAEAIGSLARDLGRDFAVADAEPEMGAPAEGGPEEAEPDEVHFNAPPEEPPAELAGAEGEEGLLDAETADPPPQPPRPS